MEINIYDKEPILLFNLQQKFGTESQSDVTSIEKVFHHDLSLNPTPVRAVAFQNQYVDTRWGFLFGEQSDYILQSAYLKPQNLINQILEKKRSNALKLEEDYIYFMGYNHDYANYYHWTVQCFPSLCLYKALRAVYNNLKLLLPSNLPDFALQYLDLLDIDNKGDVEWLPLQEKLYFAPHVIYPSFIGGEFSFNTSQVLLGFAQSFTKKLFGEESKHSFFFKQKTRLIYCSRQDSSNRRMSNEGQLVAMLENNYGAEVITNTGQTVKEQAKKFFDADIIIAPHGAGLSNLLYCRPGTTVIELMPDKYINPCFATLAIHGGCRYHSYLFPTTSSDGHQHNYEWEVDITTIEAILKNLLKATTTKWL